MEDSRFLSQWCFRCYNALNMATSPAFKERYENLNKEQKKAVDTFEGPLNLGAKLAGCDSKKTLKALSNYAIPLGIAFQIQDDIFNIENDYEVVEFYKGMQLQTFKDTLFQKLLGLLMFQTFVFHNLE